jgi:hypothetical protein
VRLDVVLDSVEPLGVVMANADKLLPMFEVKCHGSKGPWLKVSVNVTCSAQVLSVCHKVEERIHKTRGVDDLGLGTKLRLGSQHYLVQV